MKKLIKDKKGFLSIYEILLTSIIIIVLLIAFNISSEINITTPQEIHPNQAQETINLLSFHNPEELSVLEITMINLKKEGYTYNAYSNANNYIGSYLNQTTNKNYLLIEKNLNQTTIASKGNINTGKNIETAIKNIKHYQFVLYLWD
ncbi:MAG: hypothetical protein LBR24_03900 [Methanobrevibacter sp.]|jgi:hypothetical protein|nr:hypothetical protein [Methanobrevibacter sp.]